MNRYRKTIKQKCDHLSDRSKLVHLENKIVRFLKMNNIIVVIKHLISSRED